MKPNRLMELDVCPHCGCGADAYRQQIFNAAAGMHTYRFIGECVECGASGPDCDTEADAVHAFCHPAHLMQGKTLVDTKMYELTLSMAHKWERICDGEELADVAVEGGMMNCKDCEGHGWDEDARGNMIVCKRCAGTGITLHPGDLAALARANGYVKLEPGQAVVPASALASAIRELRWLASSANCASPGLWKEENSWTVSEFNNAIRAALEGK